jgi:cell wall-associated NlpC family hydrolase
MGRFLAFLVFCLSIGAGSAFTQAAEKDASRILVESARDVLGVPYLLGGRMKKGAHGLDCQGLVFFAMERLSGCGWRSFDVFPTRSIPAGEMGASIPGLSPVATADLDPDMLRPGDVLHFVGPAENPAEGPIGKLGHQAVWVWHMGLYAGGGQFIVGDHFAGEVTEADLRVYLQEHGDEYTGLWVTRPSAKTQPRQCRRHRPMKRMPER